MDQVASDGLGLSDGRVSPVHAGAFSETRLLQAISRGLTVLGGRDP